MIQLKKPGLLKRVLVSSQYQYNPSKLEYALIVDWCLLGNRYLIDYRPLSIKLF